MRRLISSVSTPFHAALGLGHRSSGAIPGGQFVMAAQQDTTGRSAMSIANVVCRM